MAMGRRPTANLNLPPQMRARKRGDVTYYFYDLGGKPRKEKPLGKDYVLAVQKWSELQSREIPTNATITFKMACDRYMRDVLPSKPAGTRKDYLKAFKQILAYFNNPPAPIDAIEAVHVREYLDIRGKQAQTRANRERSVISTVWNHARAWGYTNNVNPCQGVAGFKESGRNIYIEDNIYNAVYECADQPTKDALDLSYVTSQRPNDVTKMSETHIKGGALAVKQGKTGAIVNIAIKGMLKDVLDRIVKRKEGYKVRSLALIVDEHGKPLSQRAIWERFDKARKLAAINNPKIKADIEAYQIRDLRAKGGTDKAVKDNDMRTAQKLLGHANVAMTERYVREKVGQLVDPTK
jgi:integrase